jgi:hypothetical protein
MENATSSSCRLIVHRLRSELPFPREDLPLDPPVSVWLRD